MSADSEDMPLRSFEIQPGAGRNRIRFLARGYDVLTNPFLNRGTAFTYAERKALGLAGLLPTGVMSLEAQLHRTYAQYREKTSDLAKYSHLSSLRDRNEVLFYRLLSEHLEEMLPIVYTPTIGEAIQRFSHWYARPHGVFLSIDNQAGLEQALLSYGIDGDDVDLLVVTDSEGILGIGDQGVGGIQIAIGKASVYTAAAGIHPRRAIPIVLDVGTDNLELLSDELYLGERHGRVRGERYDAFIEHFVETATRLFPHAMLHWEDFGASNAHRILQTYRDRCCTFNDDVQGTAAIVLAAAISGSKAAGLNPADQRIVIHGAGTAGIGIADLIRDEMIRRGLTPQEAYARFWCLGSKGLIVEGMPMRPFQAPYARPAQEVAGWARSGEGRIGLADVVRNVKPTMLIGTSAQRGSFTEELVRDMAAHTHRPIIMPLSNPTRKCEAVPADLLAWTQGRALIATGSPFDPVTFEGTRFDIAQANNALVFPGLGLGVAVCRASRVSDGMIAAAARAVASLVDPRLPGEALLPSIDQLRFVSATVALAVAEAAAAEGLATVELTDPVQQVFESMWTPSYPEIIVE